MSNHTRKKKSNTTENKTLATIASAVVWQEFGTLVNSILQSFDGPDRVDAFRKIAKLATIKADDIEDDIRKHHEKRMGVSLSHLSLHKGMWVRRVHTKL
jgi:hypothetical protein